MRAFSTSRHPTLPGVAERLRTEKQGYAAARRRRAFCTDASAVFAIASGRARRSTLAGLAAIVISSPVAGLRPWRFFCAGLTRTVSCTSPPIRTFSAIAELFEHDLLECGKRSLRVGVAQLRAVRDSARELGLSERQGKLLFQVTGWRGTDRY